MAQINSLQSGLLTNSASSAVKKESIEEKHNRTFQELLNLQIAAMKSPNPLQPQDPQAITQMVTSYTSTALLTQMLTKLERIEQGVTSIESSTLLGHMAEYAEEETKNFNGQQMDFHYSIPQDAEVASALAQILNENGEVVYETSLDGLKGGRGTFKWDGTTSLGKASLDKRYKFNMVALDKKGATIAVQLYAQGVIEGVETGEEAGSNVYIVNGQKVPMNQIIRVYDENKAVQQLAGQAKQVADQVNVSISGMADKAKSLSGLV